MKLVKTTPLINDISDVQYKFFVSGLEADETYNVKQGRSKYVSSRDIYKTVENVYDYVYPFCKHCNSRDVGRYGHNDKKLIDENGKKHKIKVQRYYCNSCDKYSQTEFTGRYEPYCNLSNKTKEKSVKTMELDRVSLRNTSKTHKNFNNVSLSHETVRKSCLILDETYFKCDIEEMSGYFGHDEQWLIMDGKKWKYRHVLFDMVFNVPIAEAIYDEVNKENLKEFIEKTIPLHERKVIVTDLLDIYDSLMDELGFEHQNCSFHLRKNINKKISEHLNKVSKKIEKNLKKSNPELSMKELKANIENELKLIKDEINTYKGIFLDLFKQKTYEDALSYVERLKYILDDFPEFLAKYLNQEFFPKYKRFLTYLKEPHIGKIDSTNNKTENYIGNIMPKADKNKYKTEIGFINQVFHRTKNWIKNQKNQLTN